MNVLRGSLALLFIFGNTILASLPLYLMGLLRALLPQTQHARWTKRMDGIIDYWTGCNRWLLSALNICKPELVLEEGTRLSREEWYLIVCNHQSWTDILLLQCTLRPLIPPIKFFTKRELIYLPFLGISMWLLGFPYVRRISSAQASANPKLRQADQAQIQAACDGIRLHPTAVLNFTEGTRFTSAKHKAQGSRFERLLNPKVGGLAVVIVGLERELDALLDITIHYPGPPPSFWDFLCGRCPTATLEISRCAVPAPVSTELAGGERAALKAWIEALWQAKDRRLLGRETSLQ